MKVIESFESGITPPNNLISIHESKILLASSLKSFARPFPSFIIFFSSLENVSLTKISFSPSILCPLFSNKKSLIVLFNLTSVTIFCPVSSSILGLLLSSGSPFGFASLIS